MSGPLKKLTRKVVRKSYQEGPPLRQKQISEPQIGIHKLQSGELANRTPASLQNELTILALIAALFIVLFIGVFRLGLICIILGHRRVFECSNIMIEVLVF
jgi:hypothetical protein